MTNEEFKKYTDPWLGRFFELGTKLNLSISEIDSYRYGTKKIPRDLANKIRQIGRPPRLAKAGTAAKKTNPPEQTSVNQEKIDRSFFWSELADILIVIFGIIFFLPLIILCAGTLYFGGRRS